MYLHSIENIKDLLKLLETSFCPEIRSYGKTIEVKSNLYVKIWPLGLWERSHEAIILTKSEPNQRFKHTKLIDRQTDFQLYNTRIDMKVILYLRT